jgi:hypothetical protein
MLSVADMAASTRQELLQDQYSSAHTNSSLSYQVQQAMHDVYSWYGALSVTC